MKAKFAAHLAVSYEGDTMVDAKDLFNEDLVFVDMDVHTTDELFNTLNKALLAGGYVNEGWIEGVTEREKQFPTGLCTPWLDFAIPHTDPQFIERQYIAIIKPMQPLTFNCMGGLEGASEARIIFNLGIKGDGGQVETLQRLMNVFMDEGVATSIVEKTDAKGLLDRLLEVF